MKRVAIFAHYDAGARVRRYVRRHLEALGEVCDEIAFVSTAALPANETRALEPLCASVALRENAGFDFAMWADAIARIDLTGVDEVVLTNSSVFGPVAPLAPVFDAMPASKCDFWAMTDNAEIGWHLQSYFMVFHARAIASEAFRTFWGRIIPFGDKAQVIRSYEVGLSAFFAERGLRPAAFAPSSTLAPPSRFSRTRDTRDTNATLGHAAELLRMGMPYVKVELLRDNPRGAKLGPVYAELDRRGYDRTLIEFDRPARRS